MRKTTAALSVSLLGASALLVLSAPPAQAAKHAAKPTAQEVDCAKKAGAEHMSGAKRTAFLKTCVAGVGASPAEPTAPTASSPEARAVTAPSGADRTTRSKQCSAEADRRHLTAKDRNAFRHSCLATAGPVTEGEVGTQQPHPANQIKGIGVNNYKPADAGAKSKPAANPPEMAKPK